MVTELPQADPPPPPDSLLVEIATYALTYDAASESAREHALHHLLDAIARALQALRMPACTRLLGPIVPGATMARGARVPGTSYELDPVKAAFDIGTLMRWPDGQDAPPAVMPAHPADNLGALLGLTDYLSRRALAQAESPPTVRELLCAVIKANEIQGALALAAGDALDGAQLDRSVLVRLASAAVATTLLGGTQAQVVAALSNAWMDGSALRAGAAITDAGSRASWSVGDATSRGLRLALLALAGEPGCPSALMQPGTGVGDALLQVRSLRLPQPLGCSIMERARFDAAGLPALQRRFEAGVLAHFPAAQAEKIRTLFADRAKLETLPVHDLVAVLVRN